MNNHSFTNKIMEKNFKSSSSNSRASRMDLVCHYQFNKKSSQISFLSIDNKSGVISVNPELGFSAKDQIEVVSSCNGLILLTSKNKNQLIYHVFNPLTSQTFSLPQPCSTQRVIRSGLAASDMQNHFQVVLVHISSGLELEIFSSETGKWKTHTPTNLFLPVPVKKLFPELTAPPLYSTGGIYWEVHEHLLVYNVQTGHCTLIKLPNVSEDHRCKSTKTFQRCLWESEGRVHYCYTDVEGVHTWYLLNEKDLEFYSKFSNIDFKKFNWALADSLNHQTLTKNHPKIFHGLSSKWKPHYLSPFAYNESSQTMYMQLPGTVISYNSKTGVSEEVFTFEVPGKGYNCTFLPFVYGDQGDLESVGKQSGAKIVI